MPDRDRDLAKPDRGGTTEFVRSYYTEQADACGSSPQSTMPDEVVRAIELSAIREFMDGLAADGQYRRVLEIGCGNGYLLSQLTEWFGDRFSFVGVDATPDMIALSRERGLPWQFVLASVTALDFPDGYFDAVISERVLINLLSEEEQIRSFTELGRVVRTGGVALLVEGFRSGLDNLNRAREEFLLPPIPEPDVNFWFTEERWRACLGTCWSELPGQALSVKTPENFLSSHYFMTRFFHDVIRPEGGKLRNTEFARFFATALPPVGDYSPLRLKLLRRQ